MSTQPSRLLAHCPLCQGSYRGQDLRMIGEHDGARLFHCLCQHCGHAMIALMFEAAGWASSIGLVTDLEAKEAERWRAASVISSDECVTLYQALEHKSEDLCRQLLVSKP